MKKYFIGVDPGQEGGVVVLDLDGKIVMNGGFNGSVHQIRDLFRDHHPFDKPDQCFAILEQVSAMPGQGVSSCFKFGFNYGIVTMALAFANIPYSLAVPRKWMNYLELPKKPKDIAKTQWKKQLMSIGQRWFPKERITLQLADALLIAEYCRRIHVPPHQPANTKVRKPLSRVSK